MRVKTNIAPYPFGLESRLLFDSNLLISRRFACYARPQNNLNSDPTERNAKLVGIPSGRHGRGQRVANNRDDGYKTQMSAAGRQQADDLLPAQAARERRVYR